MPNHIHFIIVINKEGGHRSPPLQSVIGRMKSYTTKKYGSNLWQRSFYDHIIRGEADYQNIWEYINSNHLKWEKDELYEKN